MVGSGLVIGSVFLQKTTMAVRSDVTEFDNWVRFAVDRSDVLPKHSQLCY